MIITPDIVLFYSKNDELSNMYPCTFRVKNRTFNCNEQFLMFCKAMLFKCFDLANRIMDTDDPVRQHRLGKKVEDSEDWSGGLWASKRAEYCRIGMYAKYSQNPALKKVLLETGDRILAEASRSNLDWGIGFSKSDPESLHPPSWTGGNLCGLISTTVREQLRAEERNG